METNHPTDAMLDDPLLRELELDDDEARADEADDFSDDDEVEQ